MTDAAWMAVTAHDCAASFAAAAAAWDVHVGRPLCVVQTAVGYVGAVCVGLADWRVLDCVSTAVAAVVVVATGEKVGAVVESSSYRHHSSIHRSAVR